MHVPRTRPVKSQSLWRGMHCVSVAMMKVRCAMVMRVMVSLDRVWRTWWLPGEAS